MHISLAKSGVTTRPDFTIPELAGRLPRDLHVPDGFGTFTLAHPHQPHAAVHKLGLVSIIFTSDEATAVIQIFSSLISCIRIFRGRTHL